jgi:hypothetical protein
LQLSFTSAGRVDCSTPLKKTPGEFTRYVTNQPEITLKLSPTEKTMEKIANMAFCQTRYLNFPDSDDGLVERLPGRTEVATNDDA